MLKEKNISLEELKKLHQQKHVTLFGGHARQLDIMLLEERDRKALITEYSRKCPASYLGAIHRIINREGGSLQQLLKRKNLNKNVEIQICKMIHEEEQNVKQEQKMIPAPIKPLVIACRLTDHITHLVDVDLNVHREPLSLSLSNQALCGKIITRKSILKLCNKATCKICIREETKRGKGK